MALEEFRVLPAMRRRGGGVESDVRLGLPLLGLVTSSRIRLKYGLRVPKLSYLFLTCQTAHK